MSSNIIWSFRYILKIINNLKEGKLGKKLIQSNRGHWFTKCLTELSAGIGTQFLSPTSPQSATPYSPTILSTSTICEGSQLLQVNAKWKKLSTSPKYQTQHFISREDSGMFQCSASNEAGYITGYTWLRVKSKFFLLSLKTVVGTPLQGLERAPT